MEIELDHEAVGIPDEALVQPEFREIAIARLDTKAREALAEAFRIGRQERDMVDHARAVGRGLRRGAEVETSSVRNAVRTRATT